ncbi:MAG: Fic family protein [Proteobacteria bacterium]|nr:Fic family protein [Pseudomonadota bacterium]
MAQLNELESKVDEATLADFNRRLDMSWIYHDSALEGLVYSTSELEEALRSQLADSSSMLPVYDEVRQHKTAIDWVRQAAGNRKELNLDLVKKLLLILAPEEGEGKGPPRYRKDVPLHRLYLHEISPPEKIGYKMRQLMQWVGSLETKRHTHPARVAAKAHYTFLHIYPFAKHNGKLGRLLMNFLLLREGYPPAVIHATDRQRYYEALKGSSDTLAALVHEALTNSVETAIRYFSSPARAKAL